MEREIINLNEFFNKLAKIFTDADTTWRIKKTNAAKEIQDIRLKENIERIDAEISNNLVALLKLNASLNYEKIKINVTQGFVSLSGVVDWGFQQESVINSIRDLKGVKGVSLRMVAFK